MADNKKVAKFGASKFEYGVVDDEKNIVAETRQISGLSEVKVELTNELKTLAADDSPYLVLSGGITEAKETINLYDTDTKMKQDLFGIKVVKGVEIYEKDLTPNYVATLFRTKMSNGKYVWVGMLKGMFSLPALNTKAQDGAPDPEADEIEGSFVPRGDQELILLIGREDNEGFDFETFHKAVFPKNDQDLEAFKEVSSVPGA